MQKYQNIIKYKIINTFAKGYAQNQSEEIVVIAEVGNNVLWKCTVILTVKNLSETFMKRNYLKQIKKISVEKVIR